MALIEVRDVGKVYGEGEGAVRALGGVSLDIAAGEFVAIMGESGSGKSTLLSVLGALNTPSEGAVAADGIDVYGLDAERRADFRREFLGFVFQNFHLLPYLSLAENVMLPLAPLPVSGDEKRRMALEALARVGLAEKADKLPGQSSGGEQERVAVARAIVNHPPILLADEPTGNLDSRNTDEVMHLMRKLSEEGATVVMVTHSERCAAFADRVLWLRDGRLVADDRKTPLACPAQAAS
jgi:putative ABC transport system ATP-binding protein